MLYAYRCLKTLTTVMSLRSVRMVQMALDQQKDTEASLNVESGQLCKKLKNVSNNGNGTLFEESKPGPSQEHLPTFNNIIADLSSDLNSDREQEAAEVQLCKKLENVPNNGNGTLFEESKPGPSQEHLPTFNNIADLSSDLNSDQEQGAAEMLEFFEDSDCSIKDKDYVPVEYKSDTDSSDNENVPAVTDDKVRTRWKKSRPENWKRNVTKKGRIESKAPKLIDCTKCRFKCSATISEEKREVLCQNFWALDFNRRKDFILNNVDTHLPIRIKSNPSGKKRPRITSKEFYFNVDDKKLRVCKAYFTQTLCISKEVVEHAFLNKGEGKIFIGTDKCGGGPPKNKTKIEDIEKVKQHIESFPVMESHYTRSSSKRKYLDCKLSITTMYSMYKQLCEQHGTSPVSSITYRRIFCNNYNYSFFTPKKDQCLICTQYKTNDQEKKKQLQQEYEEHVTRKEDCYTAKARDKARAINEANFVCATFDLQCVLQIPSSDVSPMYYSRKICTYNLTVYELAPPNKAFCYSWTELHGKRGSLEIGTCLFKYINQLPTCVTELSLFSDTCSGQNRNQNVTALLLYLVQKNPNLMIIEQKFLESGHSYMEVDSMHSAIERAQKYVPVFTMHDWLTIFRMARTTASKKKPFLVQELKFQDFLDLDSISKLMKNKVRSVNNEKVNWLKVKCFRYQKAKPGILEYRYDHTSDYQEVNVFGKSRKIPNLKEITLKSAYTKMRPISSKKKEDLLKLCKSGVIPDEFHAYYYNIPSSNDVQDVIPEPALEDSDLEVDV